MMDILEKMKKQNDICDVIESILRYTFPNKFMTIRQIHMNYTAFSGQKIEEEELKKCLNFMVEHLYKTGIYCINNRNHYKFLF